MKRWGGVGTHGYPLATSQKGTKVENKPMSQTEKWLVDKALATWIEVGDLVVCDSCERHCMRTNIHARIGSMRKEMMVCPECDLPELWSIKYSKSRGRPFYVYFDFKRNERCVRWSHPNPENPLHVKHERGEWEVPARKRQRGD
jgi:hypothetical protein